MYMFLIQVSLWWVKQDCYSRQLITLVVLEHILTLTVLVTTIDALGHFETG